MTNYTVALVDDHVLIRKGLARLIDSFESYKVLFEADNGNELIEKINSSTLPDIILLDINMPKKDGYETALWLKTNYPQIKVLALSMYDSESAVIRMLKNGARGYILKDAEPLELKEALDSLSQKGYHYSELITGHLIHSINKMGDAQQTGVVLNEREIEFLKYACTELSYKEIAEKMFASPRTIESYRDNLCQKLNLKTRVGLVMYAIKNGIVNVDSFSS